MSPTTFHRPRVSTLAASCVGITTRLAPYLAKVSAKAGRRPESIANIGLHHETADRIVQRAYFGRCHKELI